MTFDYTLAAIVDRSTSVGGITRPPPKNSTPRGTAMNIQSFL